MATVTSDPWVCEWQWSEALHGWLVLHTAATSGHSNLPQRCYGIRRRTTHKASRYASYTMCGHAPLRTSSTVSRLIHSATYTTTLLVTMCGISPPSVTLLPYTLESVAAAPTCLPLPCSKPRARLAPCYHLEPRHRFNYHHLYALQHTATTVQVPRHNPYQRESNRS